VFHFFVSKIVQLKSQTSAKLASFSHIPPFPDPPNTGLPLNYLPPVTHAEVYKILTSVPPKSSSADLIPPSPIKSCPDVFFWTYLNQYWCYIFECAKILISLKTVLFLFHGCCILIHNSALWRHDDVAIFVQQAYANSRSYCVAVRSAKNYKISIMLGKMLKKRDTASVPANVPPGIGKNRLN